MARDDATSALNRFGLGAMPGERAGLDDPRSWLLAQLERASPADAARFTGLPSSTDYLRREADWRRRRAAQRRDASAVGDDMPRDAASPRDATRAGEAGDGDAAPRKRLAQAAQGDGFRAEFADDQRAELAARHRVATTTATGFRERLLRFWSNHFAVSADKRTATLYAAPLEREALRPHATERFADLLLAAERHPAMLRYLDNAQSVGDDSRVARRAAQRNQGDDAPRRRGLNENLAREILELHTLGAGSGYTQADVTEFARALTGWGTPLARGNAAAVATGGDGFAFNAAAHEPGVRTVLGQRYAEGGEAQGRDILAALAVHPATARHVSTKLARHFVADAPPPALVDAMVKTWADSDGDIARVLAAMVRHDAAWSADARKFRTPDDFAIAALRAGGVDAGVQPQQLTGLLQRLGQPAFTPRSPAGFGDGFADWSGPDALWKRVQAAQVIAQRVPAGRIDPLATAADALGAALDADTRGAIARAESEREGLALLFASPAFQWRS